MDDLFVGSPGLSDLDSISITSTPASEPQEEYALDGILAERDNEGVREYLVKWQGYDILRSTWEGEDNFRNDLTIPEWEKRKIRVVRGEEAPFDVADLELKIEKWNEETEDRKARRQAKRKKLGFRVALEEPEENSEYEERFSKASSGEGEGSRRMVSKESPSRTITAQRRRKQREPSTSTDSKSEDDIPLIRQSASHRKKGIAIKLKRPPGSQGRANRNDISIISTDEDDDDDDRVTNKALSTKKAGSTAKNTTPKNVKYSSMKSAKSSTLPQITTKVSSEAKKQDLDGKAARSHLKAALGRSQSVKDNAIKDASARKNTAKENTAKAETVRVNKAVSAKTTNAVSGAVKPKLPFMSGSKDPVRPINRSAHKSAPSKPEVTGSAIFSHWNQEVRRQGPWQARPREPPKASENKVERQPKTLSWKNKYHKAGRNELAPDVSQLNLFNPKNVPQNRKPVSLSVNTATSKRPFQMIQDELAKENPLPNASKPLTDVGDDPMSGIEQTTITDTRVESPMAMDVNESIGPAKLDNAQLLQNNKDRSARDDVPDPWSVQHQAQNERESSATLKDAQSILPKPATIPTGPRRMVSATASIKDHGKSFIIPKRSRSELVKDVRFTDSKSTKPSEITKDPGSPHPCPPKPITDPEGGHHDMHEDGMLDVPNVPEQHTAAPFVPNLQPFLLKHIEGDQGMINKANPGSSLDFSDVYGTIVLGIERNIHIDVRLRGANKELKLMLMTVKVPPRQVHFWLEHVCTADDYKQFFHKDEYVYYGAGHVEPHIQTAAMVNDLADVLKLYASGGVFFTPNFAMLIYPSGTDTWEIFDKRFTQDSPRAALRFIIRTPIRGFVSGNMGISSLESADCTMETEPAANTLFRKHFNIEYNKLLPPNSDRRQQEVFFLMYRPDDQDEHDALVKFLEANNAKIYSSLTPGAWDHFANTVDHGILLIHESFTELHSISHLSRVLRKSINVFNINLRPSSPNPFLTRLFPHGGALLFTDSFILSQPEYATRILKWFYSFILTTKVGGTWKIAMRPRFREWLLSLTQDRPMEEGKKFVEIYAMIYKLLPLELMDEYDDFETPLDEAPIVSQSELTGFDLGVGLGVKAHDAERVTLNDDKLVAWFAGWARMKSEQIRRYHVVYEAVDGGEDVRKQWNRKWTHLAFFSAEEALQKHSIPKWEADFKAKEEQRKRKNERRPSFASTSEKEVARERHA